MNIDFTEEQLQVLALGEAPIRMIDRRTNTAYVLLREDVFRRMRSLSEADSLTEQERRTIIQGVWRRADWDDPAMDDYAKLDPRVKS